MTKKITKTMRNIDAIALLKGQPAPNGSTVEQIIDHLTRENELLARKNSSDSKKPTKVQAENEEYKNRILDFLSIQTEGVTATQVMTALDLPSNQKAAALLRALVNSGSVTKNIEKGKSLFSIH